MQQFNDFEDQLLIHPDITFLRTVVLASGERYNHFACKDSWTMFGTKDQSFNLLRRGRPVELKTADDEQLAWIWPWDIPNFVRDVGSNLQVILNAPKMVYDLWTEVEKRGITQELARQIARLDFGVWKEFFRQIGTHPTMIELRPELAKACRFLGGLEESPVSAEALAKEGPADDPRILKLVGEIASALGIIIGATIGIVGFVVGLVTTAATIAASSMGTLAAPVLVALTVIVHLAILGWAISVVLAIAYAVMKGLLIFGGSDAFAEGVVTQAA